MAGGGVRRSEDRVGGHCGTGLEKQPRKKEESYLDDIQLQLFIYHPGKKPRFIYLD